MAEIKTLKDNNNSIVYPQTLTSAIINENNQSLDNLLAQKANRIDSYTKAEINNLVAASLKLEIASTWPPSNPDPKTIYLRPSADGSELNIYEEWVYINNTWEKIGTTDIDLSGYATKEELENYVLKNTLQPIATQTIITNVWVGTQAEYDAIATKENTKLYLIKG